MRFTFLLFLFLSLHAAAQSPLNIELFAQANRGDERYSGSWAYIAPDGSEYALLGAKTGTAAYPISHPDSVLELGFVPGPVTNWREITVIGQHAFVVTDAQGEGHSMQVIDLGYLPDSLHLVTSYTTTFTKGHIIQKAIDSEEPYVYVMGGTSETHGVHILDVSDPSNPVEVGLYYPGAYIHDCHIKGNRLYACAFYDTQVHIVDISDKTNPTLLGIINYDGDNTHSASTTEDGRFLVVADEADGFPARIFNVEDPQNVVEVAQFTSNPASLVHNPYVRGDFCFISHNTEGLRVYDIADPLVPVEVGYYDTWGGSSGGFNGLWSACPYFPSGKIIGGNRHDGLYIWTFNDTKAARIYGQVKSSDGSPLPLAELSVQPLGNIFPVGLDGGFRRGFLPGTYALAFSEAQHLPALVEVTLLEGDSVWLDITLQKVPSAVAVAELGEAAIFPNPTQDAVTLDLSALPDAATCQAYDAAGRLMASTVASGGQAVFFTKNWQSGIYWVKVLDKKGNLRGNGNFAKAQ